MLSLQVTQPEPEVDEVDLYLKALEGGAEKEQVKTAVNIDLLLLEFKAEISSQTVRMSSKANILDYWEEQKFLKPVLYSLAIIVHAVPMTQVSVERLFSSLKFVYSDLRPNLASDLLEETLLIRNNGLFKKNKPETKKRKSKQDKGSSKKSKKD